MGRLVNRFVSIAAVTTQPGLEALQAVAVDVPLIFPLHPRAALMLKTFGFERYLKRGSRVEGIWVTERWVISHFCT